MTVTYTSEVSTARILGFPRLLKKWKGSIYKLIFRETIFFLFAYYLIMFVYRVLLEGSQMRNFEKLATYCRAFLDQLPITFVLGFYVSIVVTRWWEQFMAIPWPDRTNLHISAYIRGDDERTRMIRRTLTRYLNLMMILMFRNVSKPIKKRFPTMNHLLEAGVLTVDERICLEETPCKHGNWWLPACWFYNLLVAARQEGRITEDYHMKLIIDEMYSARSTCAMMFNFDWISIPLVYTQVVTWAIYCFVLACLFGRQYLFEVPQDGARLANYLDYYFPIFTTFQFVFYMGWLKVAEELICGYGDDDDDFDINGMIDRNVQVSYMVVDDMHGKYPKLSRDAFWSDTHAVLPYTQAAAEYKHTPFMGSAVQHDVPAAVQSWAGPLDTTAGDQKQPNGDSTLEVGDTSISTSPPVHLNSQESNSSMSNLRKKLSTFLPPAFSARRTSEVAPIPQNHRKLSHFRASIGSNTSSGHSNEDNNKNNVLRKRTVVSSQDQKSVVGVSEPMQLPQPNAVQEYHSRMRSLNRNQQSAYVRVGDIDDTVVPVSNDNESLLNAIYEQADVYQTNDSIDTTETISHERKTSRQASKPKQRSSSANSESDNVVKESVPAAPCDHSSATSQLSMVFEGDE